MQPRLLTASWTSAVLQVIQSVLTLAHSQRVQTWLSTCLVLHLVCANYTVFAHI